MVLAQKPQARAAASTPNGFHQVDRRRFEIFDENGPDYILSVVDGRLRVETWMEYIRRGEERAKLEKRKPVSQVKLDSSRLNWYGDEGLRVGDGTLLPADNGEFGGAIIWFPKRGQEYKLISDLNTQIVAKTSRGIFAVQGSDHMMFWYSKLVEVERTSSGWKTRLISDLHDVAHSILQDGDHFVMALDRYVSTLETDGSQREICRYNNRLSPQTIVKLGDGSIWVSFSSSLLRLTPVADGSYHDQWFVADRKKP